MTVSDHYLVMKYIEINLPVGQLVAMVDDEDFERVNQFRWGCSTGQRYARAYSNKSLGGMTYMHRLVLGETNPKRHVHHIDNDSLNNQKSNLQSVTPSENLRGKMKKRKNTVSQFRGVHWSSKQKKFRMEFGMWFDSEEEAAAAWNKISFLMWGDRGQLNDLSSEKSVDTLGVGVMAGMGHSMPA